MRRREICFKLTINLHKTAQSKTQGGQVNTLHCGLHQPGAVHSVHCSSSFGDDLQGRQLIEHGGPGAQPESGVIIIAVYLTHKNFDRSDGSFRQRLFSVHYNRPVTCRSFFSIIEIFLFLRFETDKNSRLK